MLRKLYKGKKPVQPTRKYPSRQMTQEEYEAELQTVINKSQEQIEQSRIAGKLETAENYKTRHLAEKERGIFITFFVMGTIEILRLQHREVYLEGYTYNGLADLLRERVRRIINKQGDMKDIPPEERELYEQFFIQGAFFIQKKYAQTPLMIFEESKPYSLLESWSASQPESI